MNSYHVQLQDSFHWSIAFYFVSLVVFGSFFVMNLTLAAIKASVSSQAVSGSSNSPERDFSTFQLKRTATLTDLIDRKASLSLRKRVEILVHSESFNRFWMVLILINTILLACEHHGMDPVLNSVLSKPRLPSECIITTSRDNPHWMLIL